MIRHSNIGGLSLPAKKDHTQFLRNQSHLPTLDRINQIPTFYVFSILTRQLIKAANKYAYLALIDISKPCVIFKFIANEFRYF